MKMVANETELRSALKEKAQEITIITSYADSVMERYSMELTAKVNPSAAIACIVAPLGKLVWALSWELQWYKIQSYTPGRLVIERKK